ncbi:hypothetical protein B0H14DRAFT_2589334 [Mycena olivaceomarginata]|nr:hypothetical protein B0H14DRAFT_2589334 [Mycena olivaceomarginata]
MKGYWDVVWEVQQMSTVRVKPSNTVLQVWQTDLREGDGNARESTRDALVSSSAEQPSLRGLSPALNAAWITQMHSKPRRWEKGVDFGDHGAPGHQGGWRRGGCGCAAQGVTKLSDKSSWYQLSVMQEEEEKESIISPVVGGLGRFLAGAIVREVIAWMRFPAEASCTGANVKMRVEGKRKGNDSPHGGNRARLDPRDSSTLLCVARTRPTCPRPVLISVAFMLIRKRPRLDPESSPIMIASRSGFPSPRDTKDSGWQLTALDAKHWESCGIAQKGKDGAGFHLGGALKTTPIC